jgi:hypothetical protein
MMTFDIANILTSIFIKRVRLSAAQNNYIN